MVSAPQLAQQRPNISSHDTARFEAPSLKAALGRYMPSSGPALMSDIAALQSFQKPNSCVSAQLKKGSFVFDCLQSGGSGEIQIPNFIHFERWLCSWSDQKLQLEKVAA
jgi:hypothetical protein